MIRYGALFVELGLMGRRREPNLVEPDVARKRVRRFGSSLHLDDRIQSREAVDEDDPGQQGDVEHAQADDAVRQVGREISSAFGYGRRTDRC